MEGVVFMQWRIQRGGRGGWSPPYPHRSFGAPLKPPQQFLNLDEEEEEEEKEGKEEEREIEPPPFLDLLDPPLNACPFFVMNLMNGRRYQATYGRMGVWLWWCVPLKGMTSLARSLWNWR